MGAFLLVVGCAPPDPPDSVQPSQSEDLFGGVLRVGAFGPLRENELDPQAAYSVEEWELFRCCLARTLISYNGRSVDEGGLQPRPDLAAALPEVSGDRMTWTFHIRSGIRYGPPLEDVEVTAGDIVRALERTATLPSARSQGYVFYYSIIAGFDRYSQGKADSISGLETPDDHTLVVHLREPSSEVAAIFALPASAPLPRDPDEPDAPYGFAEGHNRDYGRYLVSTGPYMFEQHPVEDFEEEIILVRNPSWNASGDDLRPAFADRIELTLESDVDRLHDQFDEGRYDVLLNVDNSQKAIARYEDDPSLRDRVINEPIGAIWYAVMNLAIPPFDDVHVRKAVNHVIDKKQQSRIASRSGFIVAAPFAHVAPDTLEDNLLLGYRPYGAPDGGPDVVSARGEMAQSRYDANNDGRCDHRACLGVTAWATLPNVDGVGSVRADLRKIGISIQPRKMPLDPYYLNPEKAEGQKAPWGPAKVPLALSNGWIDDTRNAGGFFEPLLSSESTGEQITALVGAAPAQLRDWGYEVTRVPQIDSRIDSCRAQVGHLQVRCWAELDAYVMEKVVPFVPLFTRRGYRIISERVVQYSFNAATESVPALDRFAISERER